MKTAINCHRALAYTTIDQQEVVCQELLFSLLLFLSRVRTVFTTVIYSKDNSLVLCRESEPTDLILHTSLPVARSNSLFVLVRVLKSQRLFRGIVYIRRNQSVLHSS